MKILGIVVEYNPFHNGHLYHLEEARKMVKPDVTVAVMSGNFVQRGEPAIISKYARCEVAIDQGVDLVLELPTIFSIQDAGGFALGSVWTLELISATHMVFGSETADLGILKTTADILIHEPEDYTSSLKAHLKKGLSFPNARKYALRDFLAKEFGSLSERIEEIGRSNNILGLEYITAIKLLGSQIDIGVVKRVGADDTETEFTGEFSSATAIRNMLVAEEWESVKQSVPEASYAALRREFSSGRGPVTPESLETAIISLIRASTREKLSAIYGFGEGLDARFKFCADRCVALHDFLDCIKTKRFTRTRISRTVLNAVFGIEPTFVKESRACGPQFLRVLGFNNRGREFLSCIKKGLSVPLITTPSMWKKLLAKSQKREPGIDAALFKKQLFLDFRASSLFEFLFPQRDTINGIMDFREPVQYREE